MTPTNDAPAPGEGMEEMAAIAQIVSEWRHGPLLSPEALRRIRALVSDAPAPSGSGSDVLTSLWACQAWGDGSSAAGFTNVVCPDCDVVIAADQPIDVAVHIAALHNASLASDASPRGEAVAWVPQSHLDFLAEGRANNRPSNALVHDRPNEEMGWTVPLYAHPAPASAPAEVEELVEAVKHLSAVSDGVWVQGVSDSEMALLSTAWKRVDAALAALASPATRSEEG